MWSRCSAMVASQLDDRRCLSQHFSDWVINTVKRVRISRWSQRAIPSSSSAIFEVEDIDLAAPAALERGRMSQSEFARCLAFVITGC